MMNKLKSVCHISVLHSLFDDRIYYKQVRTLIENNYDVSLLIRGQEDENRQGVRIKVFPEKINLCQRIIIDIFTAPVKVLRTKALVIHFHDPELILMGLLMKIFRKKVIYDVHELVYYQIADKKFKLFTAIIQRLYLLFENLAVRFFDSIVLAEEGYLPYYMKRYAKHTKKFHVILNYPDHELINSVNSVPQPADRLVFIYAGGITRIRGIKELISSMEKLGPKAELWLVGQWESDKFRKECEHLTGWQFVQYKGLLKLEEVYKLMKLADVGIALLYPLPNYETSLPVKAFEYMACSLPMILSEIPLWRQKFSGCSLFVNPYDTRDIVKKMDILYINKELRSELGNKGKELVNKYYSWQKEKDKLIRLYENIH